MPHCEGMESRFLVSMARSSLPFSQVIAVLVSKSGPRIVGYEAWLEEDGVSVCVEFAACPFFEVVPGVVGVTYGGCECVGWGLAWE